MTEERTKSQKAAATIKKKRPKFYQEIGAEGGKKTPGTFRTKRGLAKRAGQRSGQARKIKSLSNQIEKLELNYPHVDADDQAIILTQISELTTQRAKLELEYEGGHSVEGMEYEQ